jgi:hypothetical protein
MSTTTESIIITDYGSIDFALRVIESIAFSLHCILGITEPCTGCLRGAFNEKANGSAGGGMPIWFWPIGGILLGMVAIANFSSNNHIVLIAQFYIIAFHFGGTFYHIRLNHHPVSGFAPGIFVIIAFAIAFIRMNSFVMTLFGTICCGIISILIGLIIVKKPSSTSITTTSTSIIINDMNGEEEVEEDADDGYRAAGSPLL